MVLEVLQSSLRDINTLKLSTTTDLSNEQKGFEIFLNYLKQKSIDVNQTTKLSTIFDLLLVIFNSYTDTVQCVGFKTTFVRLLFSLCATTGNFTYDKVNTSMSELITLLKNEGISTIHPEFKKIIESKCKTIQRLSTYDKVQLALKTIRETTLLSKLTNIILPYLPLIIYNLLPDISGRLSSLFNSVIGTLYRRKGGTKRTRKRYKGRIN